LVSFRAETPIFRTENPCVRHMTKRKSIGVREVLIEVLNKSTLSESCDKKYGERFDWFPRVEERNESNRCAEI